MQNNANDIADKRQRLERASGTVARAWGIRGRLTVLALLAIVPLVLDRVHGVQADRDERIEAASRQALELARRGADKQSELVATTRSFLQVVARSFATFAGSGEACGSFLANLATGLPWARGISVATADGRIACSSNPPAVGLDISDRSHFQQAVRTGEFFVSDYTHSQRMAAPSMFASFPQRAADGSIEAVAVGAMDLSWLRRGASALAERSGSVLLMVDGTGTVITRQPDADAWVGRQVRDRPLVRAMLARSEGTVTEDGLDGVRRIFGFVRLPGTEARLAVGLDESEVLGRLNRAMWTSYAQLGLISCMVLVGIWFGGERLFVQPIGLLARTASRLAGVTAGAHAPAEPWATELVPLAAALDDMAGKLAARERALRASNNRLVELAQIDGLTKLANRRTFDTRLQSEWKQAAAAATPLALLMVDVDYFKRLNDHDGHVAGDACLRTLGKILGAAVRKGDLAARYGGEEFALLLPGADREAALRVAERLRAAVEDLRIAHVAAPAGHVTVSIGVASLNPRPRMNPQMLVEMADAGLYEAKRGGRNTVAKQAPMQLAAAG